MLQISMHKHWRPCHRALASQRCTLPARSIDLEQVDVLFANRWQLSFKAAAPACTAGQSAQALAALLASQLYNLLARSNDLEYVVDLFANCLQLCLQAAAHAHAARPSVLAVTALLDSQP